MARLWYRPSAAEFVIGLGAQAEVLDETESSLDPQQFGRAALVPLTAQTFQVYTDPNSGAQTTDLLDSAGDPMTSWTSSTTFASLGTGPAFQGPDGHEGDLYLSADGTVFYRVSPSSDAIFQRLTDAESALASLQTTDLANWSSDAPANGETPVWNSSTGQYEPSPTSGAVSSVNGKTGAVSLNASDVGASGQGHVHSATDVTSGTFPTSRLPVGAGSSQVAAGNHTHSLDDLNNVSTAGAQAGWTILFNPSSNTWSPGPVGSGGTGGVTDHGALTGLSDDDHPQYLTNARGDIRYVRIENAIGFVDVLTGTEPRPAGFGKVHWYGGSTQPTNYNPATDVWLKPEGGA